MLLILLFAANLFSEGKSVIDVNPRGTVKLELKKDGSASTTSSGTGVTGFTSGVTSGVTSGISGAVSGIRIS